MLRGAGLNPPIRCEAGVRQALGANQANKPIARNGEQGSSRFYAALGSDFPWMDSGKVCSFKSLALHGGIFWMGLQAFSAWA
jgi:hypothetical protein